jgi:microcystin degradation protein MlrC
VKIAVAGIGHETNTFSTLRTTLDDFRIRRGAECIQGEPWESLVKFAELAPCLVASATPNGLVAAEAYETLKRELLERLAEQLPVDGLFLDLHGAMHVDEIGDGETDLLRDIRSLVGPDLPIAASLDLHGNLSQEFVSSVNILSALRTAPHIDRQETLIRIFGHLVRAIRENHRPATAMIKLPLLLPGEYAVTAVEPSKSLYGHIAEIEAHTGVWDASLMIACAWTDSPNTSVSTLVVGEDLATCDSLARSFAERVWDKRAEFGPEVDTISAEEAIRRAGSYPDGPIFISESGDNVTAGGAGDVPFFLGMLLESGLQNVLYAAIADRQAVYDCSLARQGGAVTLSLGGKLDAINGKPLILEANVLRVESGIATVQSEGVTLLITDGRRPFHTLSSFGPSGLDPLSKKVVVVKQGYLAPELRERCSTTFMALTPGFTDLRLASLPYRFIRRPVYPLDDL